MSTWCPACGLPENHGGDWRVCVRQLRRTAADLEKAYADNGEPQVQPAMRRPRPPACTSSDIWRMRQRHASGESFSAIGRATGLHHTTVMYHVNGTGQKPPPTHKDVLQSEQEGI